MKKTIQIAIVDDHKTLRMGMHTLLSNHGYEVVLDASNGQDLIEQLENATKIPQICITDIEMPIMNGYDLTAYLKAKYPQIKVLVYSFYEHEFSIINILKKGAIGYIFKSSDPSEIISAIESIQQFGFYHSDALVDKSPALLYKYNNHSMEFTQTEIDFMSYSCSDLNYEQISKKMNISKRSVEHYRDNLYLKLHISSRPALVLFAMQTGIAKPFSEKEEE